MKITKARLREIIAEELNEAVPLGLTYADHAAARGLGKVGRPQPDRPEDPADELLAKWAADIRSRPASPTLDAVVDFLMNYRAFENAYDQALEDEREEEDRDLYEGLENLTPENLQLVMAAAEKIVTDPTMAAALSGAGLAALVSAIKNKMTRKE